MDHMPYGVLKSDSDSSLPCCVFVWDLINTSDEERTVNISFMWEKLGKMKTNDSESYFETHNDDTLVGISLKDRIKDVPCTFTLAKVKQQKDELNERTCTFNNRKHSKTIWQNLTSSGIFPSDCLENGTKERCNTIGINGGVELGPGKKGSLEFCLVWDMPVVEFLKKTKSYKRFYTRYFGDKGTAGQAIASYALKNYKMWEKCIHNWQKPIMMDKELPDWYKGALMNELYYVADGGTTWFDVSNEYSSNDPRAMYGLFGYLEGHEYRMYNTYDVHFYASFALATLWPNLQVALQYSFKDAIPLEIDIYRNHLFDGGVAKRKVTNSVPHDLGDPCNEPFVLMNSYNFHDVSEWRDLNAKFILQVFRDYNILIQFNEDVIENDSSHFDAGDGNVNIAVYNATAYLEDMYPYCQTLINVMKTWDKDNDGLIENCGFPDQTFDMWIMTGPSAYCGGLWLSALFAMVKMAQTLGRDNDAKDYSLILNKGKESFQNKLWTGEYYLFDSNPKNKNVVMSDQLCGHWYLRSCGYEYEVFPKENIHKVLDTIYTNNVKGFYNGKLGASNGYVISRDGSPGSVDNSSITSSESWTGVTYGLASLMLFESKVSQAFDTAGNMYKTISETFGLNFETPEAFNQSGNFRSIAYMRPLSIWAMQHALNSRRNNDLTKNQ